MSRPQRTVSWLLALNGAALAITGLFQMLSELGSHFLSDGPLGSRLAESTATLGLFEAHGLALFAGIALWRHRDSEGPGWHLAAASIHLLLGASNLLFWSTFDAFEMTAPGIVATSMHALFFGAQVLAAAATDPDLVRGPGASFRIASVITLLAGLFLHGAGLVMGREAFVERLFTPGVDALLAIPMTWAGISGWLSYRRARCETPIHRGILTIMLLYFTISIPIHLQTLITWRTDYVQSFPDWYSLPIFVLLVGLMAFVTQLRFAPSGSIEAAA